MSKLTIMSPETKRAALSIEGVGTDGVFSGYATVFGKVDLGKDRVEKGAFRHSLKGRAASSIRMLFQHDPCEPIGVWQQIREDAKGLYVKGRIISGTVRGAEILNLMRAGAIDGLSIGFRTEKSRTDRKSGIRSILEADLWEISVVTFPMLPMARVNQIKSGRKIQAKPSPTVREFERWLTQDAGLSRRDARIVITKGFAALACKRDAARHSPPAMETTALRMRAAAFALKAGRSLQNSEIKL